MADTTNIAWCDATWSPWIGCSPVHVGCENCYAAAQAGRFDVVWGQHGTRRKTSEAYWKKPLAWNRKAEKTGTTFRVFPSLCDVFEDWPHVIQHHKGPYLTTTGKGDYYPGTAGTLDGLRLATMADLRRDLFGLIDQTPNLTWILGTKRPENIRKMWEGHQCDQCNRQPQHDDGSGLCSWRACAETGSCDGKLVPKFRPNIHLLYSASDQPTLEAGLRHLVACQELVPVIGLSFEPLVGPIRFPTAMFHDADYPQSCIVDWVVVGGESGPHARPCEIEWIRSIVEQCREAGVPCFVKQDAGRKPGQQGRIPDELWRVKELP